MNFYPVTRFLVTPLLVTALFCLDSNTLQYLSFFSTSFPKIIFFYLLGHPFFFLCLASSDWPKFLAFSKKKSNDTWNNSINLKNKHSNSIKKNRNIFYSIILSYCVFCDSKYMWMLTFNVSWGTRAFYSKTSCDFFSFFFSQSNRPTQYQETHLTLNEKKGGWPYAFVVYEPAEQNFHIPCMSRTQNRHKNFFSLVAFLLHLTVSLSQRSFESLFQHVKHCLTIFLSVTSATRNFTANSNTHVCKFGWTKFDTQTVLISLLILLQVLLSSWCSEWKVQSYFPRDLAKNFCVAKNFSNNFFVTWAQKEFAYLL